MQKSDDDVFEAPEIRQPTILSVYNQKGGVGKTTTAVNLSLCLAAMGKKVVLIDFDPQSSATSNFIIEDRGGVGIHDLLNRDVFVEQAVTRTAFDNLSIIVGARKLYSLEHALDGKGHQQRGLRRALHFSSDPPDYIIIDCPPALGHLAAGALAASDQVVLPVFPGRYALDGLRKTLSVVDHIQKGMNPTVRVAGVLMLSVTNDEAGRESLAQLRDDYPQILFRTAIAYDVDVVKATYRRMPAVLFNPQGRTAARFVAMAWEVVHGRGSVAAPEEAQKVVDRIQQWHDANDASYSGAQRPSAVDASGNAADPAERRNRPKAGFGVVLAGAIGLILGFTLGVTLGEPLVQAVMARLAQPG